MSMVLPSTLNSTWLTPLLSEASAVIVKGSSIGCRALLDGAVMFKLGLVVSAGAGASVKSARLATYSFESVVPMYICLLYTSDAADERSSVDLGGRRIIKKKKQ